MIYDVVESAACLQCDACAPGCPSAAAALLAERRETMRRAQRDLLASADPAPRQCWHCAQAPCVEVCPAGAMRRDAGTGLVWVDASRCVGCWTCVLACPFGAVLPSGDESGGGRCDEMGVETVAGDAAVGLDVGRRRVVLRDGREVAYEGLLVATGAAAVRIPVPGADLPGVVGLVPHPSPLPAGERAPLACSSTSILRGGGAVDRTADC